jgi:hypothetical protein
MRRGKAAAAGAAAAMVGALGEGRCMRGEAAALRLVGPGVTAWYSAPCCAGGGGGGWSVACGPPRFLGVRAAGLVERRVGMAQAVVGKLAAVRHGRVDRRVVPQDGGEQ